jgi:hypothetical protein
VFMVGAGVLGRYVSQKLSSVATGAIGFYLEFTAIHELEFRPDTVSLGGARRGLSQSVTYKRHGQTTAKRETYDLKITSSRLNIFTDRKSAPAAYKQDEPKINAM